MNKNIFIAQLDAVSMEYAAMRERSGYNDISDLPKNDRQALVSRAIAAVRRAAGVDSAYMDDIDRLVTKHPELHIHMSSVIGVAEALRADLKAGYFESLSELVRAELFSDFLEMAQHLLVAGYKDAAAVIAGSSLEAHLRALCKKAGVSSETVNATGDAVPKKASILNADLQSAKVYSQLEHKSVIAWLDLRNKAAHGKYSEYDQPQVHLMISGVRDFVIRLPA